MTAGRNDPCPCGSGKKYKKCCLPGEEVISLQAVRDERNHEALLDRLLDFTADLPAEQGVPDGMDRYFGGPPPEDLTDDDHSEPLDWVHFGYRSPATGTTLCERMLREDRRLTEQERGILQGWATGAVAGFFHVTAAGPREIQLRRIGEQAGPYVVTADWQGLKTDELLAAWLLPTPTGLRFGYYQATVAHVESRHLEHLLQQELTTLRRQWPEATWDDLYRELWPRLMECMAFAGDLGEKVFQISVPADPQVVGSPRASETWEGVAERLTGALQEAEARPEEVAGALRLWWDAVHALEPRVEQVEPWVGAVIYLISTEVYGSDQSMDEAASLAGSTASSVESRAREIREALHIAQADPRYADLLDPVVRTIWRTERLAGQVE